VSTGPTETGADIGDNGNLRTASTFAASPVPAAAAVAAPVAACISRIAVASGWRQRGLATALSRLGVACVSENGLVQDGPQSAWAIVPTTSEMLSPMRALMRRVSLQGGLCGKNRVERGEARVGVADDGSGSVTSIMLPPVTEVGVVGIPGGRLVWSETLLATQPIG